MVIGKTLYVKSRREWRSWLAKHHKTAPEIWLVYYRKETGKPRISYDDAVLEALAFGWIDSTTKSLDTERFAQRFSPRRPKSQLSQMNLERARELVKQKKMTKAGLAALTFLTSLGFQEAGAVAFSLGFRLEFFAFLPAIGFGFGAMAMIGQNIGAGNLARAKEAFIKGLQYGVGGAAAIGVVAAVFAGLIIGIFTEDPVVTDYARSYMWVVALVGYGFLAAMMVEASAFQAIGKSWPGFWIFVLRFGVVSIPLGYVLTQVFHLPIVAIWAAILAGNIIAATAGYFWIKRTLNTLELKEVPVHV